MENPDRIKKVLKKAVILENGDQLTLAKELIGIEENVSKIIDDVSKIDKVINKIESDTKSQIHDVEKVVDEKIKNIELQKGDKGDTGDAGSNYILTETDKRQIAKSIKVPVVEKIVERTEVIKEQPIITTQIKEVAVADSPEIIREKIEQIQEKNWFDPIFIKDFDKYVKNLKSDTTRVIGANRNLHQLLDVNVAGITTNQSIKWDGTSWIPYTPSSGATWGAIIGTLSDQTDLQNALDSKQDVLGYTPYNATNPDNFTTLSAVAGVGYILNISGQDLSTADNSTSAFTTLSAVAGVGYLTSISGQDLSTADNSTSAFTTISDVSALPVSTFTNDSGYITSASVPSGANPTGTIGLTAVNGSTSTFLRSDGAPALSQSISPTWTNVHIFSLGLKTGLIYPSSDSTTALKITKADGTTTIFDVDSTNKRIGINTTAPTHTLTIPYEATGYGQPYGLAMYQTTDQTTNYGRGRLYTDPDGFHVETERAGTVSNVNLLFLAKNASGNTGFTLQPSNGRIIWYSSNSSSFQMLFETEKTIAWYPDIRTTARNGMEIQSFGDMVATSGTTDFFKIIPSFKPTSGTATHAGLNLAGGINQTGGASGITRGIYVNQTLTAVADYRALETANGKVKFTDTLSAGSGSLAGSLLDLAQTWNTSGTPTALKLNVTDTASNASSLLVDLQVGGTSKFKVDKAGNTTWVDASNLAFGTSTGTKIGTSTSQKIGFYNATPVVQPTALTTQLTTITASAPGTPDYAIQDLTNIAGYGFVTADEGQSVLKVIANLQTRVAELESKLQSLGLLA